MNKSFIDWVDVKGELWYKAEDILLCLGYKKNRQGKELLVLHDKNCKPSEVHPSRKIDGLTWWNETSIVRFKKILTDSGHSRSKVYLKAWSSMLACKKTSINSVVLKSVNSKPTNTEGNSSAYRKIAKDTNSLKAFIKEVQKLSLPISCANSWKTFACNNPQVWEDIKSIVEPRVSRYSKNIKSTDVSKSIIFTLTFTKSKKVMKLFAVKGEEIDIKVKSPELVQKLSEFTSQGYLLKNITNTQD